MIDFLQNGEGGLSARTKINDAITEANKVGDKVDKVAGKGLSTEDYSTAEKTKLGLIEAEANKYVHPVSHAPSIITQDLDNRFVTDAEKATWNRRSANRIIVGTNGHYATLKEAVDWFNASATQNFEILLDNSVNVIADTVSVNNASYNLMIRGYGTGITSLIVNNASMDGKPIFDIKTDCDINRLSASTPLVNYGTHAGENFINYTGADLYSEVTDVIIDGFYNGILDTAGVGFFMFNAIVENCVTGVTSNHSNASHASTDIEVVTFENCGTGIDLIKAPMESFIFSQIVFNNAPAGIAIKYDGANYIYNAVANIFSCTWNHVGTFLSGFDFTLVSGRDANIEILGCIGTEDKKPHAKINVIDNANTTTIVAGGTYYKAVFTNGTIYTCKVKLENNKLTQLTSHKQDVKLFITGNLSINETNAIVNVGVKKNDTGAIINPFSVRCATSGQPYGFSIITYLEDVVLDDFVELFVTTATAGKLVTLQDVNIFYEAM